jgi:hypothetical protein
MAAGQRECHRREGVPWEATGAAHVSFPLAETARELRIPGAPGRPKPTWSQARTSAIDPRACYRHAFPDRAHASFAVADYIEVFCNRRRLHDTLGNRTSRGGTRRIPGRSNRCLINYPRSGPRIVDIAQLRSLGCPPERQGACIRSAYARAGLGRTGGEAIGRSWR